MPLAGAKVRASDIKVPKLIVKAASESVSSSTVFQNDDDIAIPLAVGTYVIDLFAIFSGAAAGDIKLTWSSTGTMASRHRSVDTVSTSVTNTGDSANSRFTHIGTLSSTPAYGVDGSNNTRAHERLVVDVTVAGTLTLQWAQQASNATATVMQSFTHVEVREVEEI